MLRASPHEPGKTGAVPERRSTQHRFLIVVGHDRLVVDMIGLVPTWRFSS
jgi:hypothetical protein